MSRRPGRPRASRSPRGAATAPRRGFGLVEVLVGLAILSVGLVPLFHLMSGSRSALGQSQEMLELEGVAFQAVAHTRSLVAAGEFVDLGDEEGERVVFTEGGLRCEVRVRRVPHRPLFRLDATARHGDRFFALSCRVADPLDGIARATVPMLPAEEP